MEIVQQTMAVLAVLGLLGMALWWLRSKGLARVSCGAGRRKNGRHIELIERLQLTPQHSLHLVRVDGQRVVLAASPSGCAVVECGTVNETVEAIH